MKKLFLATALGCLLVSSNVMARWYDGTEITEIRQQSDGLWMTVTIDGADWPKQVNPANTQIKEILAIALTIKSSQRALRVDYNNNMWEGIAIK